ncbi:MAG: glycosyltransferase family 4 protein [Nitrospinota bacterium]
MNDDRPLRIALVRNAVHRHGGVERYVWQLAQDLASRGHEAHLFARHWEGLPSGVICRPVGRLGGVSVLKAWSFASGVVHALEGERFDIVYNFDRAPVRGVYRAGEGCHREWLRVAAAYCFPASRVVRRMGLLHAFYLWVERRIFSPELSLKVVTNSKKVRDEILLHYGAAGGTGIKEEDIPVIYNGVDLSEFSPVHSPERKREIRKKLGVPPDDYVVLFVGSGFFRKGLVHLFRSASRLQNERKELRLLVAGHSGRKAGAARMARRVGVGRVVHFLGGGLETADVYRASDVFVLPSLYEPFGNACLEALASGLPCILSRQCGLSEVLTDGENAYILEDPTDADEMAAKLSLLMDEELRRRVGLSGRRLAERFPVSANTDRMLEVYREVGSRNSSD